MLSMRQMFVLLAAVLVFSTSAQSWADGRIVIESPAGSPVEGGYIVPYGTVVTAHALGVPNDTVLVVGRDTSYLTRCFYDQDRPLSVIIDTREYGSPGDALTPIQLSVRDPCAPTHVADAHLADAYLWVVNTLSRFEGVFELSRQGPIRQGDVFEVTATLTPEIIQTFDPGAGDATRELEILVTRLAGRNGGVVPVQSNYVEIVPVHEMRVGRHSRQHTTDWVFREPGIYEFQLVTSRGGAVVASLRVDVLPAQIPPSNQAAQSAPVRLYPDFTRTIHLPGGDRYPPQTPIPIEVHWTHANPDKPLPDFSTISQRVVVFPPAAAPLSCIDDTRDLQAAFHVVLRHVGNGVFRGEIPYEILRFGEHWLAIAGVNDPGKVQTTALPLIDEPARLEIVPPTWNGTISIEPAGTRPLFGQPAFVYDVSIDGEIAGQGLNTEPTFRVLRRPLGGPGNVRFEDDLGVDFSIEFPDGVPGRGTLVVSSWEFARSDVDVVMCDGGPCYGTYLAREPIPTPAGLRPVELENILDFANMDGFVDHPWPVFKGPPLQICDDGYKPPPIIAADVAMDPPAPAPGTPVAIGLRLENTGGMAAADVTADVLFINPESGEEIEDLTIQEGICTMLGGGIARCRVGDMEPDAVKDLLFRGTSPRSGDIVWQLALGSAGDLGGMVRHEGVLGEYAEPVIEAVVVVQDQMRIEDGIAFYPYPFVPGASEGDQRYLLVVGENLPHEVKDAKFENEDYVNYHFAAASDTTIPFYADLIASGWQRFYETPTAQEAVRRAVEDGHKGLLVDVRLVRGVTPGLRLLSLNGAEENWALQFGDVQIDLNFVRILPEDVRMSPDDPFEMLETAYMPGRVSVRPETMRVG